MKKKSLLATKSSSALTTAKSLLAIVLSLTLILGACGGATSNDNHVYNTETEIGTEHVHETETELVAMNTESVDATEIIESTELETEVAESTEVESETTESTEKETEKSSETKSDTKNESKTEDSKKDESSKNESNTNSGSNNSGSSNSGSNSNTGSNSGNNSNTGNNDSDSSDTGSSNGGTTTTPEPETPVACSHTNTGIWGGNGSTHDIICDDCFMNKGEVIVLRSEACNFVNGSCTGCGVGCLHSSVSWDSSSSQSGHCNMICNVCGIVYNNVHAISWGGGGHSCSRCGAFWPCEHTYSDIRGSGSASHDWYCTGCGAYLSTEPHAYVNGSCSACGWADPNYNPTPEPTAPTNVEALPEESVEVTP